MTSGPHTAPSEDGVLRGLCIAYAELLRRQRSAASAFVRWSRSRRSHEFCWLERGPESLITVGKPLKITPSLAEFSSVMSMKSTLELNPYERQVHYGYPYVVGSISGKPVRAPLLTLSVRLIDGAKGAIEVLPKDEAVRFNSLPFRTEADTAALELALAQLIESTPSHPVRLEELRAFCETATLRLKGTGIVNEAQLDGRLERGPKEPRAGDGLCIVDCAALFVAPQTSYFLVSDLDGIGQCEVQPDTSAFGALLLEQVDKDTSDDVTDRKDAVYPFPSNPSQRRVANLVDEEANRIVVVQGPPGTGKSLTIANLVCHLVASGKTVLVSSQKDKAMQVVDELLLRLDLQELPMTLLRNDMESKQELRARLDSIEKTTPTPEAREAEDAKRRAQHEAVMRLDKTTRQLVAAIEVEHDVVAAAATARIASSLPRRLVASARARYVRMQAASRAPRLSDDLAVATTQQREALLQDALSALMAATERRVSSASKLQRNQLREFSRLLGRRQSSNFGVFDRLKKEPERCRMLLSVLPCWIMAPDDVARLFPCEEGLFDVAIVDEASQCDLPSMLPVLYRAKQAVIAGDSRQMQARRFQFTNEQVAKQAWHEQGLDRFDPERWLDPTKSDLLLLADIRADEHAFLDEHYRCLPSIIGFSNERWYAGRLRIMRDGRHRVRGDPSEQVISLHHVTGGSVQPGTQENLEEAQALIDHLAAKLAHPAYADATFGVICLFEEQMRLVAELVAERIAEDLRLSHRLIVVNPDGFQGDERDVIYYSLSYDAGHMTKSQIAARQMDHEHIQGMLNVAFTRARDEIHVFLSAKPSEFAMASGKGAIRDWLEYCAAHAVTRHDEVEAGACRADSEFEAEVQTRLRECGLHVLPQYPACGYRIDMVVESDQRRVAIECDGEPYHLDEHGHLRLEDVYRQEVLERAGWSVLRIPYRAWRADPQKQVNRVLIALQVDTPPGRDGRGAATGPTRTSTAKAMKNKHPKLTPFESAIVVAIQDGQHERAAVLRHARGSLGYQRLGPTIKAKLTTAIGNLSRKGVVHVEDGDLYLSHHVRQADVAVHYQRPVYSTPYDPYRLGRSRRRRW